MGHLPWWWHLPVWAQQDLFRDTLEAAPVLSAARGTPIPPGPTAAHTQLGMGAPSMGPAMLSPRYS